MTRSTYKFLGVRLTVSSAYANGHEENPVRPAGAQLAVYRSVWLTVGKWAYGWIQARPWPMLQNLQVVVFGMLMETECGAFVVLPNQVIPKQRPLYGAIGFPVRIESRNATPAAGVVRLIGHYTGQDHTKLWGTQSFFVASPACQVWMEPPIGCDAVCTHVEYEVQPNNYIPKQWQRYKGRPEWEEQLR
jgi:hypothetical protein